jgi:hypothetical protein
MAQAPTAESECSLDAQRRLVLRSARSRALSGLGGTRLAPQRLSFSAPFGVIIGLFVACSPSRSAVFEWEPVNTGGRAPLEAGTGAAGGGGEAAPAGSGESPAGRGAAGVAGRADPTLDPDASFEWTATVPTRGVCTGGRFSGTFSCDLLNAPLGLPIPSRLEGTIVLELVGPTERQTLDVSQGTINVITASPMSFDAGVKGTVTCSGNAFVGEVQETTVTKAQLGTPIEIIWVVQTPSTTVQGSLAGRLDPQSLALAGEITIRISNGMCQGPFDLRAQL